MITALVRWHGLPPLLLEKPDLTRALVLSSMSARCDWLDLVATADARGRSGAFPSIDDRLELFRLACQELHCWQQEYPFYNERSRMAYFLDSSKSPGVQLFEEREFRVTVMAGLPGSGKSHWVKNEYGGASVSLDDIRRSMKVKPEDNQGRAIQEAREQARKYLRSKTNFVWDATNTTKQIREKALRLFYDYNAKVRIIYLEVP